jgi:hypothetical protein
MWFVLGTAEVLKVGIASITLPTHRSISGQNDERKLFNFVSIKAITVFCGSGDDHFNGPRLPRRAAGKTLDL